MPAGDVVLPASSPSACSPQSCDWTGRPRLVEAGSNEGIVAADNGLCSEIGAKALGQGGHAVDAAVATALCLGVLNSFASGLGGGSFIMIRGANGSSTFIDAREQAPSAASPSMFQG